MTELTGRALGPDWVVARHTANELHLEHRGTRSARRIGGAVVVSLGMLSIAAFLFAAPPESARLILWPLSALSFLVAVMSAWSALRNFQRWRLGVSLRITPTEVEGWSVGMSLFRRRAPVTDVARVAVEVFPHPPLSLVLLELVLRDGTRLTGPEVSVPDGQPHPLGEAARAAETLLQLGKG